MPPDPVNTRRRAHPPAADLAMHHLGRFGLVVLLATIIVVFSLLRPDSFGTWSNLRAILANETVPIVLALAELIVLVIGHFDLSIAATLGLGQVLVVGLISGPHLNSALAIAVAIAACGLVGLINGCIIVRFQVGSFIATLASGSVIEGVQLWYTNGETLFKPISARFTDLGRGITLGVPNLVIVTALVSAVLWCLLTRFPVGRKMYVIGSNAQAATLTGIRTERYTVVVFVMAGLLAGLGGVMLGASLGTAQPAGGDPLLIPAFTGALLSTATVQVARYNVLGTVVAILLLAVTVSGLQQLGAPLWVQPVFNGTALITAVALSGWAVRSRAERARRRQLESLTAADDAQPATEDQPDLARRFDAKSAHPYQPK